MPSEDAGWQGGGHRAAASQRQQTQAVGTRHPRHRWRQAQGSGRAPAVEGGRLGARSRWLGHMDRAQRLVESGAVCGTGPGTSLATRKSGATSDCLSERVNTHSAHCWPSMPPCSRRHFPSVTLSCPRRARQLGMMPSGIVCGGLRL